MDVDRYVNALSGINYSEWIRVKTAIDRYFDSEKREQETQIQLSKPDTVKQLIRSQFGEK